MDAEVAEEIVAHNGMVTSMAETSEDILYQCLSVDKRCPQLGRLVRGANATR